MENKELYSRKDFLTRAGSTALFAFLGIQFIPGCSDNPTSNSMDDDDDDDGDKDNDDDSDDTAAIVISGSTITLNLAHSDLSGLTTSGGWLLISDAQTLVVNVDGSTIRAFTSICTHQGCSTDWSFGNSQFVCGCHNSRFNTSGQVVGGPAPSDLTEFSVERNGDMVTITK